MRWILILMFVLILTTSASAIETYKLGTNTTITDAVYNSDMSKCTTCTCEVSVYYPDGSILVLNKLATTVGGYTNYTISSGLISAIGRYKADFACNLSSGDRGFDSFYFEVTPTGQPMNSSKSSLYIAALIILFILLIIFITLGMSLPFSHSKDEMTGYIFALNNLKYVKMFAWGFAYIVMMLIMYFSWILSYSYLDLDSLANIFRFVFYTMIAGLFPGLILFVYILIANAVRDHKLGDMLSRGFKVRE